MALEPPRGDSPVGHEIRSRRDSTGIEESSQGVRLPLGLRAALNDGGVGGRELWESKDCIVRVVTKIRLGVLSLAPRVATPRLGHSARTVSQTAPDSGWPVQGR
jgi:hypothetical protein